MEKDVYELRKIDGEWYFYINDKLIENVSSFHATRRIQDDEDVIVRWEKEGLV